MIPPVPPPGDHGGDGAAVAAALGLDPNEVLDLSQSMNPVAPDPAVVVAAHLDAIGRYPDTTRATTALAEQMGVPADRLLLTNGGAEAISLVASELGGWTSEPEFSLIPRALNFSRGLNGPSGSEADPRRPDAADDVSARAPRWRSNPHNPSGRLAKPDETAGVWDESFFPLATGRWTRADPEAVVVGSLTKLLACPGLRAGYVLAEPDLLERLRARQPKWSVNSLVASALGDLLAAVELPKWSSAVAELREQLVATLREHGLSVRPSDAPWVLVDEPGLRERLAVHSVVVRDCASFGMPGVARIAVPPPEGIARLRSALRACRRPPTGSSMEGRRARTPRPQQPMDEQCRPTTER